MDTAQTYHIRRPLRRAGGNSFYRDKGDRFSALADIIRTVWPRRRPSTAHLAALLRLLGSELKRPELWVTDLELSKALDLRRQRSGQRPDAVRDAALRELFAAGRPSTPIATIARQLDISGSGCYAALRRLGIDFRRAHNPDAGAQLCATGEGSR